MGLGGILRITHYALRITHYALRITHYALRITHYALRITHYALRITHYVSRITYHALRLAARYFCGVRSVRWCKECGSSQHSQPVHNQSLVTALVKGREQMVSQFYRNRAT